MTSPCFCAVRKELAQNGFALLPGFWTGEQLASLQLEAEVVLESAGAYDGDAAFRRSGCVFEVTRPWAAAGGGHGFLPPPAAKRRRTDAAPTPTSSPAAPPAAAVRLTGLGLLADPRLHALVRAALGFGCERCGGWGGRGSACGGGAAACSGSACGGTSTATAAEAAPLAQQGGQGANDCSGPFLINEQFICKPPRGVAEGLPLAFAWHRDSDWCRGRQEYDCSPYVSVWTAVDDMTADNGPLTVLPGSHAWDEQARAQGSQQEQRAQQQQPLARQQQPSPLRPQEQLRELPSLALAPQSEAHEEPSAGGQEPLACDLPPPPATDGSAHLSPCQLPAATSTRAGLQHGSACPTAGACSGRGDDADDDGYTRGGGNSSSSRCGAAAAPADAEAPRAAQRLLVKAGTVVVTLDTLLHASSTNCSRHMRRAWMPQFAMRPLRHRHDGSLAALAVPLAALAGNART